ncbi:MAG: hypothetical protein ACRDQB_04500, partial [Thermocrispum sp.]
HMTYPPHGPQHGGHRPPRRSEKSLFIVIGVVAVLALGVGTWLVIDSVQSGQRLEDFAAARKRGEENARRMTGLAKPAADDYIAAVNSRDKQAALQLTCHPDSTLNKVPLDDAFAGKAELKLVVRPVSASLAADGFIRFDITGTWHGDPIGDSWLSMVTKDNGKSWCAEFGFERPPVDVGPARKEAEGFVAQVNDGKIAAAASSGCTARARTNLTSELKEDQPTLTKPGEPRDEPSGIEEVIVYYKVQATVDGSQRSASVRVESADGGRTWCIADLTIL